MQKAFGAVTFVDPAERSALLSAGISQAISLTLMGAVVASVPLLLGGLAIARGLMLPPDGTD